jgi:predicted PurR-regulated permease PerM
MEQTNWQRRRDILISIVCIGIIIWFVWNLFLGLFVHAVLLLLLSMALAFLITPGVNFLEKNKVPRLVGTIIMYIVVLVVVFLLFPDSTGAQLPARYHEFFYYSTRSGQVL